MKNNLIGHPSLFIILFGFTNFQRQMARPDTL